MNSEWCGAGNILVLRHTGFVLLVAISSMISLLLHLSLFNVLFLQFFFSIFFYSTFLLLYFFYLFFFFFILYCNFPQSCMWCLYTCVQYNNKSLLISLNFITGGCCIEKKKHLKCVLVEYSSATEDKSISLIYANGFERGREHAVNFCCCRPILHKICYIYAIGLS